MVAIAILCVIKLSFITLMVAFSPQCIIIITFSNFITLRVATDHILNQKIQFIENKLIAPILKF